MSAESTTAITVERLTKFYGSCAAVDDVSFEVERGEIFALLGPNGAGKTTTVEILEGLRASDSGKVGVLGLDPVRDGRRLKDRIGVMLQEGGIYPAMTARQALELFAHYYSHPLEPQTLISTVGLADVGKTPYRRMSGGQKQRLSLALALVGNPEIAFLDEPTSGMDPHARRATWELISRMKDDGKTILLTTHNLDEAERLADRVAILRGGKILASGSPASLRSSNPSTVRVRLAAPATAEVFRDISAAREVAQFGDTFVIETGDAATLLVQVATCMRDIGIPVLEMRIGYAGLEDAYLELTEKVDAT